jgi:putative chitinase
MPYDKLRKQPQSMNQLRYPEQPKYCKILTQGVPMSFDFDFTPEKLANCINNSHINEWYEHIVAVLPDYEINTVNRVACWLAQMGHESGDFKFTSENLNYSAKGLRGVFGKYFPTDELAQQYQRQPEKIANRVYANRMGNGAESSGDGWKFRGRGIIQITGKSNYTTCSETLYGDPNILLDNPDILCEMDGAVRSACWFWNSRYLNDWADSLDNLTVTKKINGGTHGLADRDQRLQKNLTILQG